jgi:hypothetical protein
LFGPAIDKIANKYCFAGVVSESAMGFCVSKFDQQSTKRISMTVNITYYVVLLLRHYFDLPNSPRRTATPHFVRMAVTIHVVHFSGHTITIPAQQLN